MTYNKLTLKLIGTKNFSTEGLPPLKSPFKMSVEEYILKQNILHEELIVPILHFDKKAYSSFFLIYIF